MSWFDVFRFKRSPTYSDDDAEADTVELSKNVAFRSAALTKCANYVARHLSKARFVIKGIDGFEDWTYLLNVQPNPNQVASDFWSEVVRTLITEGELLLVHYKQHLYVADGFAKEKTSLSGHRYRVSSIQGETLDKVFNPDDVIYLKADNENLQGFVDNLWADYGELLGRLINRQKTANQVRFTMALPRDNLKQKAQELADGGAGPAQAGKSKQQRFFERVTQKIKTDSVVAIPLQDANGYQEYSNRYSSKASFVDDIRAVKQQYVDEVAEILGIPTALLRGDMADNQKNYELFIEAVMEPLVKKLVSGLTPALFTREQYAAGAFIKVVGLHQRDLFAIATPADKLIAAGLASADEIREEIGLPPLPNGLGQILYTTKNYERLTQKGAEDESS